MKTSSLPEDLWRQIATLLHTQTDLRSLILASRIAQRAAMPVLYQNVVLCSHSAHSAFLRQVERLSPQFFTRYLRSLVVQDQQLHEHADDYGTPAPSSRCCFLHDLTKRDLIRTFASACSRVNRVHGHPAFLASLLSEGIFCPTEVSFSTRNVSLSDFYQLDLSRPQYVPLVYTIMGSPNGSSGSIVIWTITTAPGSEATEFTLMEPAGVGCWTWLHTKFGPVRPGHDITWIMESSMSLSGETKCGETILCELLEAVCGQPRARCAGNVTWTGQLPDSGWAWRDFFRRLSR
ncbi:hypothetical protein AURDEDRAFT_131402 [Auricularia subglabra TFB-10046 SS5]|uniref:Uncharacterized protein n=1 Tax=Auricularia subglabra (strain TFB-10046 / SS5) TaxID=717982 RepID=J0D5F8_AURST|nr:hypothetical protein AURDEDRAFT_131402 [Auricularia subglabra TFB-10046 SS5]